MAKEYSIEKLAQWVMLGGSVTVDEAHWIMESAPEDELYEMAHRVTQGCAPRKFDMCSIINARSGLCSEDCAWCAQSAHHSTEVEKYLFVGKERCLAEARYNEEQGVNRFSVVTSGRSCTGSELKMVCEAVRYMNEECEIELCASLGLLGIEELELIKRSGVVRYHCNLESAPSYFPTLCTTHTIEEKLATLRAAREVGLKLCSGGIIGMGESAAQRVELALALRGLGVDSIPINILQPIVGTPLQGARCLGEEEILRTIALFRFVHPTAYLRFAGGRGQLTIGVVKKAMHIGVNSAIVGDLLTTIGSKIEEDKEIIREVGYEL